MILRAISRARYFLGLLESHSGLELANKGRSNRGSLKARISTKDTVASNVEGESPMSEQGGPPVFPRVRKEQLRLIFRK